MSQKKINIWWETNSEQEKWRVNVLGKDIEGENGFLLSSENADFPVNVEDYGTFEEDLLIQSLKEAFPGAEISMKM